MCGFVCKTDDNYVRKDLLLCLYVCMCACVEGVKGISVHVCVVCVASEMDQCGCVCPYSCMCRAGEMDKCGPVCAHV